MIYDHDEEWAMIPDCNNMYAVSNTGEVYSFYSNKILSPSTHKDGYQQVQLYKNGKHQGVMVHRLVANAFLDNPDNLPCVNHLDEVTDNNDIDNLAWCTYSTNNTYGFGHQRRIKSLSKPVTGYDPIRHQALHFKSTRDAQRHGYSSGCISECCNGKCESYRGMFWSYDEKD